MVEARKRGRVVIIVVLLGGGIGGGGRGCGGLANVACTFCATAFSWLVAAAEAAVAAAAIAAASSSRVSRGGLEMAVVGNGTSEPLESSRRPLAQLLSDTCCPCRLTPRNIKLTTYGYADGMHVEGLPAQW